MKSSLTLQFSSGLLLPIENKTKTRMHSSRMRTVRCNGCLGGCLGVCVCAQGAVWPGGVWHGGVYPPGTQRQTLPLVDRILDTRL